jgi:hypothetical protein
MIAYPASISKINNQKPVRRSFSEVGSSIVIHQSSIHPPLPPHSLATVLPAIARRTAAGAPLRGKSLFFLLTAASPMVGAVPAI